MELISENEQFLDEFNYKGKYNTFIEDCIEEVLNINKNIKWQKCSKCNNYYPYHKNFFCENQHSSKELNVILS